MTIDLTVERPPPSVTDANGPLSRATEFPITVRGNRLCDSDEPLARRTEDKIDVIDRVCKQWKERVVGVAAGYTYLGQFLAHETVSRAGHAVQRSWKLDLDSVYGTPLTASTDDITDISALVKDAEIDEEGRFKFTAAIPTRAKDLRREATTNKALIPEFRNDDQLIIAQLHLTIQLFHNSALGRIKASEFGQTLTPAKQFIRARKYVVATMQRIYWEEYLPQSTLEAVYGLATQGLKVFNVPDSASSLPLELTHAALRFGHSQVRPDYRLHKKKEMTLVQLFELTGEHGKSNFAGIPADSEIDWRFFFPWKLHIRKITPQSGLRINPKVIDPMTQLPETPSNIILRNLAASSSKALPSGQHLAACLARVNSDLGISVELPKQLSESNEPQRELLHDSDLWERMPLWLYVLVEAAVRGEQGLRLGPVGSVLLCETVRNAISTDDRFTYEKELADCNREFSLPTLSRMSELATFTEPEKYAAIPIITLIAGLFIDMHDFIKEKLS